MEKIDYVLYAEMLKVLAEPNRLKILNLLSNEELCSSEILKELNIVQSTLSHHMKVLVDFKLVRARKKGKYFYFNLNPNKIQDYKYILDKILFKDKFLS